MTFTYLRRGVLVLLVATALGTAGCGTATKVLKKTAWFTVKTTGKITKKTIKVAAKVAKKGIDLTADAATKLAAQDQARDLVIRFWANAQQRQYHLIYRLLSKDLRRQLPEREFAKQAAEWATRIKSFEVAKGQVHRDRVKVPGSLLIQDEKGELQLAVTATVVPEDNDWRISGWEFSQAETEAESDFP